MKIIKLLSPLVVAGLLFSVNASATTETLTFTNGIAPFSASYTSDTDFDNFYLFNISAGYTGTFSSTVSSNNPSWPITFSVLSLLDPSMPILTANADPAISTLSLPTTNLAAGNYALEVIGSSGLKNNPGSPFHYSGTVNLVVSAVPEPSEWMLMLSGFGLIGWIVRRRSGRSTGFAL